MEWALSFYACQQISGMMKVNGGFDMHIVKLGISSREKINKRFLSALKGEVQGAFIIFESPTLLFKVLSGKRWKLLEIMTGTGPMSIREAARRLGRDVKAVHGDVHKLLNLVFAVQTTVPITIRAITRIAPTYPFLDPKLKLLRLRAPPKRFFQGFQ